MTKYGKQIADIAEQSARMDERTEWMHQTMGKMDKKLDGVCKDVQGHSERLTKVEERQGILSVIGTSVSTGISSGVAILAAWIVGSQK